ncbi:MAG: hypothetical protein LBI57_08340 [Helicobacteraceae bacterium]|nr:hypothetical protein [Helicobacteraceae bacterium]
MRRVTSRFFSGLGWLALALTLFGCGGGGSGGDSCCKVSLYDSSLNLLERISANKGQLIDLSVYSVKYGGADWYKGGQTAPLSTSVRYWVDGDVNLYAASDVIEISDELGLRDLNNSCGTTKLYIMLKDIALADRWIPFCEDSQRFIGTLNGNEYNITDLWVDDEGQPVGLFRAIGSGGAVKNLGVKTADGKEINGTWGSIGGIVGFHYGTIENVRFDGNVSGAGNYIGGIAGASASGSVIKGASFEGNVSGAGNYTGGIVGYSSGGITSSRFDGNVSGGEGSYIGGIAGRLSGADINNSYSKGYVGGESNVGGVVGYIDNAKVNAVYSSAIVNGVNNAGGVAGVIYFSGSAISEINNSYSVGNVIAEGNFTGGIVGSAESSGSAGEVKIANNYSEGNISGDNSVSGIVGGIKTYRASVHNNAAINEKITANNDVNSAVGHKGPNNLLVQNNFALSTMSLPAGLGADGAAGVAKTSSALQTESVYSASIVGDGLGGLGWSFGNDDDHPWRWGAFGGYLYPTLYWQEEAPKR